MTIAQVTHHSLISPRAHNRCHWYMGQIMEARLSCWLVLLSVNITARSGGRVAGLPWPDPSHMQFFLFWAEYCYVMWLIEFVYVCLQFACMYCWICLGIKNQIFLFHYGSSKFKDAVCLGYLHQPIFLWYFLSWTFILIHISKFLQTRYFWFSHQSTPRDISATGSYFGTSDWIC